MSSFPDGACFEDFPHFRTEWRRQNGHFRHMHSPDLCLLVFLVDVPMREVDMLSSRQAYSFPFCPRVYKYAIGGNHLSEVQLTFDVRVLVEHVPKRVSNQSGKSVRQRLNNKMGDLLRCFEYLHQRFGSFGIKKEMIGWTQLGVIKAWLNSDFSINRPEEIRSNEQEMVGDLVKALEGYQLLDHLRGKQFSTLRSLREHIQQFSKEKRAFFPKKQAFKPIDNLSLCVCQSQTDRPDMHHTQVKSSCTRKDITFSYSNKDLKLNSNLMMRENNCKSSIAVAGNMKNESMSSKVLTLKKEFTFGNNLNQRIPQDQTASLKLIYPIRRNEKKYSFFQSPTTHFEPSPQFKIQKLTDYFSKCKAIGQQSRIVDVGRFPGKERPVMLHYSTSTNPYNKYIHKKSGDDKSMGSLELKDDSISQDRKGKENKSGRCGNSEIINELYESVQRDGKRTQQIKNDLDALFDINHDFDEQELENELENILF